MVVLYLRRYGAVVACGAHGGRTRDRMAAYEPQQERPHRWDTDVGKRNKEDSATNPCWA